MRIGIDANPILGDRGGVGWHTYYLLQALLALKEDVEFVGYVRPGAIPLVQHVTGKWEGASRVGWVEAGKLTMRWHGKLDELDLYHGTNFKMGTVGRFGGLVTIYDLWLDRYPQYSGKLLGQRASFYRTRRTARRARKVMTISDYSARDIESLYGLPRENIVVIPCGVSHDFQPVKDPAAMEVLRHRMAVPTERFILFVGGADPRKNHQTLIKAYAGRKGALKDYSLVMVGDSVHRFGDMREAARSHGIENRVVCPGRLNVAELRVLYSNAAVFVFPSIYEGFGMPVLEAMACGAPVITSNTTALPEAAGNAAVLVNPEDAEELGNAMIRVLEDSALRDNLRAKGFERVKQFTWERAAHQTMAVYREVCQGNR